ncbi:adventurous gliding motility protein GltG [Archangium primigenium]|uniref:adventurous gliding motility protein GltG n=1 Tax=[Archangium] primigenium TaxID=2792470 RepID=UPI001959CAA2|nr:adventurous gliding motility protein GltG [Archangium primigenium]MBM7117674.1 adventurous gliding motility protein GltG [Archangium primigenium]
MPVPLTLKVFKGDTLVTSKDFERDIIKIGRLASAHLCLEDDKVSRIHSVIEVASDGSLSIIDMGSVEGTYVNGKRVNKGQLSFGDEIKVGGTVIRLEDTTAIAAANLSVAAASTSPTPSPAATPAPAVAASLAQAAISPAKAATPAPVVIQPAPVAAAPVAAVVAPKAAVKPAAVVEAPVEAAGPRVRRVPRKGSGPTGLGVHFLWGDQRVGDFFLAPGQKRTFSVGSAKGVDFIMGDSKLGGERFEVVRTDGQSFTVLFSAKMKGELVRKGETHDLKEIIESGKASHEGEAYALTLKDEDLLSVDLGGVTLEACLESVPKKALAPMGESVDFSVINIFLVLFFLASMFVISASNLAAAGEQFTDELAGNNARLAKLIVKPPDTQKNKFLEKLNQQKAEKQAEKAKAKKEDTQQAKKEVVKPTPANATKADKKAEAKNMAAKIFGGKGGAASLFAGGGIGGDLKGAMGNMFGAKTGGVSNGLVGMGLRGGGGGGGGGDVVGIGSVGTKGRAGGVSGYGSGMGSLGGTKQSVEVGIASEEATVSGSLDKELIRQVIQRNRGQIRFCYESLLNRFPKLGGKVAIRFTIASEGNVVTSSVAQSTAGNSELEQCVAGRVRTWSFPKPKGGGSVAVTYPFIFKAAGE